MVGTPDYCKQQGVRLGASQCVRSTDRSLFRIKGRAYATQQLASCRVKMASGYVVHAVSVIKDQTEIDTLIVQMQDAITRFVGNARSSMLRMWRKWKQKAKRVPHRVITPIGVCNRTPAVWANTAEERERNKTSEAVEPWSPLFEMKRMQLLRRTHIQPVDNSHYSTTSQCTKAYDSNAQQHSPKGTFVNP
jgi:hypothetical protein